MTGFEYTFLVVPVLTYQNMDSDMLNVVYENKGKSGIYRMINLTNNKAYVGSSVNLGRRFSCYYSFKHIDEKLVLFARH